MTAAQRSASERPSRQAADNGDDAPEAERLVSDPETLKALSDPLRLRILETMVTRVDQAWSAKELAHRLDVPQTRLYHHLELLLDRDLVRVAEQRVVSGIIETRYRVAALSFRLDHRLLSGDAELNEAGREVLHTVFDSARDDVARALQRHFGGGSGSGEVPELDPNRPIVSRGLALLRPARAAEFRERLANLIKEFEPDEESAGAEPWGLLLAFYRSDAGAKEPSRD